MEPIPFNDKFIKNSLDKGVDLFDLVEQSIYKDLIYRVLHSKYNQSIALSPWLKEQVDFPLPEVVLFCSEIESNEDYDIQIINILTYIRTHITYISDISKWKMNEYWARAYETVESKQGDCEDGAILAYVCARLKGIPANRLTLFAGDVEGGGHCWLGYKPKNYPLNYAFIDWCYWVNLNSIQERPLYTIIDSKIYDTNYKTIWFGFNELHSYKMIQYDFR